MGLGKILGHSFLLFLPISFIQSVTRLLLTLHYVEAETLQGDDV